MEKYFFLAILFFLLGCTPKVAPPSPISTPGVPGKPTAPWEATWGKVLSEAHREGKVVVYSPFARELTVILQKAFMEKYGISVEYLGGQAVELAQKILMERKTGLDLADVFHGTASISLTVFKPNDILAPLEPALILPEVVNPNMWIGGKLEFVDRDRTIFPHLLYAFPPLAINTNMVNPQDIKSYRDLLAPRWKGKIVMTDPSTPGVAGYWFAATLEIMGLDFMRELAKQEPVVLDNLRLPVEWLAQGKFPVAIAVQSDILANFQKEGAPLKKLLITDGTFTTSGGGNISLIKQAPHPYAAKLFVNWLLSREAQTLFSKAALQPSARVDVPTEGQDPLNLIQPGVKYVNSSSEDFLQGMSEKLKIAKEIFGPLKK